MIGWHFLRSDGRRPSDEFRPPPGGTEKYNGIPVLGGRGLEAYTSAFDALMYANGDIIRQVRLGGKTVAAGERTCGTVRRELWRADAAPILRDFARWIASGMVLAYWPDAPDVVRRWLATGDELLCDSVAKVARQVVDTCYDYRGAAALAVKWATAKETAWAAAGAVAHLAANAAARREQERGGDYLKEEAAALRAMGAQFEEMVGCAAPAKGRIRSFLERVFGAKEG